GLLEGAGLLFFAFAGYARLATLGEEVRDPERTIPRAIGIAVVLVVTLYAASAAALIHVLGHARLATSARPFVEGLRAAGAEALVPLAVVAASLAAGGALMSLMLGVSRTTLAMARDRHLPQQLARVHARRRVPHVAELTAAVVVGALVVLGGVTTSIAFSSFCVLLYYAIAHAAALTIRAHRALSAVACAGLAGCAVLAASLPVEAIAVGSTVVAAGALSFAVRTTAR
ncbi:MAG: transporter, partial [Aeromicrobium sp.]|nr:transporter [Aeromicrobium sp.]